MIALVVLARALPTERLLGVLQASIDGLGMWGPVAFAAIYVAAALLFVPGSVLTLAAGALFGVAVGTVIVSIASTTAAALAFLIARYFARDAVRRRVQQSRKLVAIDDAIGERGWKIVALLRLSPAVPFNLQNYLYGVTAVRFWPAIAASWVAMLPGTVMFVYLGSLGRAAIGERGATGPEWALRIIGLVATVAVTAYVTRVARRAIRQQTAIDRDAADRAPHGAEERPRARARTAWSTGVTAAAAIAVFLLALWVLTVKDRFAHWVDRQLGLPPSTVAVEAYGVQRDGPAFEYSVFDELLRTHVDDEGLVDYAALRADPAALNRYVGQLAGAPFRDLGRDQKLALLINAYNAFTLRLILDYYPIDSIRDIPAEKRWEAVRWNLGGHTWSLDQIEHEQIRPKFAEPRIHFALVCAALGCPPLRQDAYTAGRLERQLTAQAAYVHSHSRWLQIANDAQTVYLTALYDWYGGDFIQHAPSVLDYAARHSPPLRQAIASGRRPRVKWLEYDWRLNDQRNTTKK